MTDDRITYYPVSHWKSGDDCNHYFRELKLKPNVIDKLRAGGVQTFRDLERADEYALKGMGIVDEFDLTDVLTARSFWLDNRTSCNIL